LIADIPLEAAECLDRDALAALQHRKLTHLLRLAKERSPFYARHLQGVDLDGVWSLETVPMLTKELLIAHSPPESTDLLTAELASAYIFRSGGTTGSPKFSPFSFEEFRRIAGMFLRTYGAAGLRPTDRVANLFAAGSLYASFVFINRLLEEMGCLSFPFTGNAPAEVVGRHLELFPINTLVGFPTWLLEVVQRMSPEAQAKIEKIFYAGEHLYPEEQAYLHERLPNLQVLASAGYGAVDTGIMGFQCQHSTGSVHHVHADQVLFEIVDPATMRPVTGEEEGLLLITTLDRFLMPVIRYAIGDRARWVEEPCACGRTLPRFALLGRNDDLRIGYATVASDEIMRAVGEHSALTSTVQMIKEREDMRDRLIVHAEARTEFAGDREALAADLKASIFRHKPDLYKLVQTGHVHDVAVRVLGLGEISRMPVTGKVRRTVDRTLDS